MIGIFDDNVWHVGGAVHQRRSLGRMTHRSLDFFVPVVPDEQNLVVVPGKSHRLAVHLGHQGAGRVDRQQVAIGCPLNNRGRNTVGAEDDV